MEARNKQAGRLDIGEIARPSGDYVGIPHGVAEAGDYSGSASRLKPAILGWERPDERDRFRRAMGGGPGGHASRRLGARFLPSIACRHPRCGAGCPGTFVSVLMIRGKCSHLGSVLLLVIDEFI